jgi:hypothetical protein
LNVQYFLFFLLVCTRINRKVFQRVSKLHRVVHVRSMDFPNLVHTLVAISLCLVDGNRKSESHQAQSTPRLFLCSLCLRVCSLSDSHNQMRLTVRNDTHCCCLTCVRATYSRTKKSAGWLGLSRTGYCKRRVYTFWKTWKSQGV